MIPEYNGPHDGYILHTAGGDGWDTQKSLSDAIRDDILDADLDPADVDMEDWITGPIYATQDGELVAEFYEGKWILPPPF